MRRGGRGMKVVLAGFNTDVCHGSTTPETISAAYARISRDPRPIGELREEACLEVEKARRSNRKIVFGFGHSSVAEHAVFNLDVTGISRLASEYLQGFRLASFTEKSQRYIHLSEDWIVPDELPARSTGFFSDSVGRLFSLYGESLAALTAAGVGEENAKEDARYTLPLCTTCQMGMTANAREIEHMAARLRASSLGEVRRLGGEILRAVQEVAPSLFRHVDPTPMDCFEMVRPGQFCAERPVMLEAGDGDETVGTFLLSRSRGVPYPEALRSWRTLGREDRRALFAEALDGLGLHEAAPRCWELARYRFAARISASAFAQLKRHRMCTLLSSAYCSPAVMTMPPSFTAAGCAGLLVEAGRISENLSELLPGEAAAYAAINASCRDVILSMNAREFYHFSRLRMDEHAQWDIRSTACEMLRLARRRAPLTFMLAGGRSELAAGPG